MSSKILRNAGLVGALLILWYIFEDPYNTYQVSYSEEISMANIEPHKRLKSLPEPAPVANRVAHSYTQHGVVVEDPYFWLKDQSYPKIDDKDVLGYVKAENAYFQTFISEHQTTVDTLFNEFKGRMSETDTSVPIIDNGYEYRYEFNKGSEYRTWIRKNLLTNGEQVFLDLQVLAKGQDYFVLGSFAVSPDNTLLAYTVDTDGSEYYTLYIKNLVTGETYPPMHDSVREDIVFTSDSQGIIYQKLFADRWATRSVNLHILGTDISNDKVLQEELDSEYSLGFSVTADDQWLVLSAGNNDMSAVSVVPLASVLDDPLILSTKAQQIYLEVEHAFGHFYILTNDTHVNRRLVKVPNDQVAYDNWLTVIAGSDEQYIESISAFAQGLALSLSRNGLGAIHIQPYTDKDGWDVLFPEKLYSAYLTGNADFASTFFRVSYESMVTPPSIYDVDFTTQSLSLRKQAELPTGYDKTQYVTTRLMAPSRDGVAVPISIVHHKDTPIDGSAPLMLYAYGAYGVGMSPYFSKSRKSMLDRGFIYAIAHTRGGDEMGYQWYLDGKLEKRQNAFNDFVDVAQYLIQESYTRAGNISIQGASAGGKMMGVVTVMAPELWRSVVLGVPFVDVLNTMLDESLPLTPPEWSEWGNPLTDKKAFELIRSYSPYDNIIAREYPPMLVTAGLNDPRVTYWEPAKWTAKMRHLKTDNNLLIMRTNMSAGHYANSGRYGKLRDLAEEYAFILAAHGLTK
jgi:oligopeptidase B